MINFDKRKILITTIEKLKIYGPLKFLSFALREIRYKFYFCLVLCSYSQNGEDLVIDKLLEFKKSGFYVDVGAYDPTRFSNTKRFYQKRWRGINIEPNLENYKKFEIARPLDININTGIGLKNGTMDFYRMFPPTLSTFSIKEAKRYEKLGYKILQKTPVDITPLSLVLDKYASKKKIDFFSIDTEGFDLEVLKSNNWTKYKPKVICIESSVPGSPNLGECKNFLLKIGYRQVLDNGINSIFTL